MDFEEWFDNKKRNSDRMLDSSLALAAWQAAQAAERERANVLIEVLKEIAEAYGTEGGIGEIAHAAIAKYAKYKGESNEP